MFNRRLWVLVMVLIVLALVPAVFATPPEEINGYFYWAPEGSPYSYCLFTVNDDDIPDGVIEGCVIQPEKPGRAQIGTMYHVSAFDPADPEDAFGSCVYSLATFDIPGRPDDPGTPRFSAHRCSGSWEDMHLVGVGEPGGFSWTGSYHFEP
jgi:hypothetical protein